MLSEVKRINLFYDVGEGNLAASKFMKYSVSKIIRNIIDLTLFCYR
ncbi:hypothetical protein EMIT040CA3_60054 [Bacillus pseudomycoides]